MKVSPEELYLHLIKQTLAFTLWPEPPVPVMRYNYQRPPFRRWLVSLVSALLRTKRLEIVKHQEVTPAEREEGKIWPGYACSMIGLKRLNNIQSCVETVLKDGIPGDLIETGVWRGGACILMRAILAARGVEDRRVFLADSFEGLPKPDAEKYPADRSDDHHVHDILAVSIESVRENFRKFGLLDAQVQFLKGWFKDTLPTAPIDQLAVMRLDGDMYESTMDALGNLYSKLSPGGFCIIDDYALKGCRQAVDEFRSANGIDAELQCVDWTGRFWRKA